MSKISDFTKDRLLAAARIEDVVGDFVELKKKGPRYLGLCPFHDDRSLGSFVVYPAKNCYKCFSCNAQGDAVKFLEQHLGLNFTDALRWLGRKYSIDVDDVKLNITPPPPRPLPPPLPTLILPEDMVTAKQKDIAQNTLAKWIYHLPWTRDQKKRVVNYFYDYRLGHSSYGHTIFWQIDEEGAVRTGKMMLYRPDGHRDKEAKWNFDFIHAALRREPDRYPQYAEDKVELRQTLFGMHLLNHYGKDADIRIVESEKTALLMAIAYGNNEHQVWMACGGVENLTPERLAPIIKAKRRIILYPDRDGIERWKLKAAQLNYDRLTIDIRPVTPESDGGWWKPEDGPKADPADVVIRILKQNQPKST